MKTTLGYHLSHPLITGWDYECALGLACFMAIAALLGFAIANMLVGGGEPGPTARPGPGAPRAHSGAGWLSDPEVHRTIRANHALTRLVKAAARDAAGQGG